MKNMLLRGLVVFTFLFSSTSIIAQNDATDLRNTYDFDYTYKLKMTTKKDEIQFDYYLKKDAGYFGFDLPILSKEKEGINMFTVMDNDKLVTAMFMEMMGKKVVKKSKLKLSDFDSDSDNSDFTIKEIGSKTILGYKCQGFVMENKESEMTFYITDEAPVSFNKIWDNNKTKMPKGFDASMMKKYSENGLMMEMHYVDKKKSKNNTTMTCIALEKTNFSINTSDYGSMLGAFGGR